MRTTITAQELRKVLHYDELTGVFRWRQSRPKCPAGKLAGSRTTRGYWRICIDGQVYFAHRLAWLYVHGTHPTYHIDHIDNNTGNNCIANLRDVPPALNRQNSAKAFLQKTKNPTGVRQRSANSWAAQIHANNKLHFLGCFPSAEEASAAYNAAKVRLHADCPLVVGKSAPDAIRNGRPIGRSGVRGVTWNAAAQKWECKIKVAGKFKRLGRFNDVESACAAYQAALTEAQ